MASSFPATPAQHRLWSISQMMAPEAISQIRLLFRLRGRLDCAALDRAWSDVVARHQALRLRFTESTDGHVSASLAPAEKLRLTRQHCPSPEQASALLARELRLATDLRHAAVRPRLIRVAVDDHVLALDFHHTVVDGLSLTPLLRDLSDAYRRHSGPPVADRHIEPDERYLRHLVWRADGATPELAKQRAFWRDRLAPFGGVVGPVGVDPTAPPTRFDRPPTRLRLEPDLVKRAVKLAAGESTTLFTVLVAACGTALADALGSNDVAIATPMSGRRPDSYDVVGNFTTTVPLVLCGRQASDDRTILRQAREVVRDAMANQEVSFPEFIDLERASQLFAPPFAHIQFSFEGGLEEEATAALELQGVVTETHTIDADQPRFFPTIVASLTSDGAVDLTWSCATSVPFRDTLLSTVRSTLAAMTRDLHRAGPSSH